MNTFSSWHDYLSYKESFFYKEYETHYEMYEGILWPFINANCNMFDNETVHHVLERDTYFF